MRRRSRFRQNGLDLDQRFLGGRAAMAAPPQARTRRAPATNATISSRVKHQRRQLKILHGEMYPTPGFPIDRDAGGLQGAISRLDRTLGYFEPLGQDTAPSAAGPPLKILNDLKTGGRLCALSALSGSGKKSRHDWPSGSFAIGKPARRQPARSATRPRPPASRTRVSVSFQFFRAYRDENHHL